MTPAGRALALELLGLGCFPYRIADRLYSAEKTIEQLAAANGITPRRRGDPKPSPATAERIRELLRQCPAAIKRAPFRQTRGDGGGTLNTIARAIARDR